MSSNEQTVIGDAGLVVINAQMVHDWMLKADKVVYGSWDVPVSSPSLPAVEDDILVVVNELESYKRPNPIIRYAVEMVERQLLRWFKINGIILLFDEREENVFSPAVFECFYVDFGTNTLAYRFVEGTTCVRYEDGMQYSRGCYFDDTREALRKREDLPSPTHVSIYENVPLYDKLNVLAASMDNFPLISDGFREEGTFVQQHPDAINLLDYFVDILDFAPVRSDGPR